MRIIDVKLFSTIVVLFFYYYTEGQDRCGTDQAMSYAIENDPTWQDDINQSFRSFNTINSRGDDDLDCPIIIPVHVIIIHDAGDEIGDKTNPSFAHIQSQIDVLNQDFGRTNPDRELTPVIFPASKTGIQFCLASIDPRGNPTIGVTRYSTRTIFDIGENNPKKANRLRIKRTTGWDDSIYLNIWVSPSMTILGFAKVATRTRLPEEGDDGIAIQTDAFGGNGFATDEFYNRGRTATHEVGHYLGLGHIWRTSGCSLDDGITDTPLQNGPTGRCPSSQTFSCGNDGDMFMNYMDYTYDVCMNAFTPGQGAYMREILNTSRSSLLSAAAFACAEQIDIQISLASFSPPSCTSEIDGTLLIQACGGGSSEYSYSLNGSTFTSEPSFTDLAGGDYTITVRNNLGIENNYNFTLNAPLELLLNINEVINNDCFNSRIASISVSSSGGTLNNGDPYLFKIDDGPYTESSVFNDLQSGVHTITVLDSRDCTTSKQVTIEGQEVIFINVQELIPPSCSGEENAILVVSASGGSGKYTYRINRGAFQESGTFTGLASQITQVYVRDSSGCIDSSEIVIPEVQELILNILEIEKLSCNNTEDAVLKIEASGGSGGYTYSIDGHNFNNEDTYGNLPAGIYDLAIEDKNGCRKSIKHIIEDPQPISISDIQTTNLQCAGDEDGKITFNTLGGSGAYVYLINGKNWPDNDFTGLTEGFYDIEIKDEHGCNYFTTFTIKTEKEFAVEAESFNLPSCTTSDDGTVIMKGIGGTGDYLYSLDNINYSADKTFSGLTSGKYILYASDGNDCRSATPFVLDPRPSLSIKESSFSSPTCFGAENGALSFIPIGGNGNYEVKVNNNIINDYNLSGLTSGNYIISLRDENNCTWDTLLSLVSPPEINVKLENITETNCPKNEIGTITVSATGGSGDLTYSTGSKSSENGFFDKMGGATYEVLVTDERGCSSSVFATVPVIGGLEINTVQVNTPFCFDSKDGAFLLSASGGQNDYTFTLDEEKNNSGLFNNYPAGVYDVTVEDNYGCYGTTQVLLVSPPAIKLDTTFFKEPTCYNLANGIIDVDASGGTGRLQYQMNERSTFNGVFNNLKSDLYPLKITDLNGCQFIENIKLEAPPKLGPENLVLTSPSCFGDTNGSISFKVVGGTGKLNVSINGSTFPSDVRMDDVNAGNYRVVMRDEQGCIERLDIFLEEPDEILVEESKILPETKGTLGSIEVIFSGGTHPYTYILNNGEPQGSNIFKDLAQGEYRVEIIDKNGCMSEATFEVFFDDQVENPPGSISSVYISTSNINNETLLGLTAHGDQDIRLHIFDMGGKYIRTTKMFSINGKNTFPVPTENLTPGMYILKIQAQRAYDYVKFMKF